MRCGEHRAPIPFAGVLELLRILEDEVPPGSATAPAGHDSGGHAER
jgi:hypothetical protein